jgi:putative aldouronate transport system substrate-binding protein
VDTELFTQDSSTWEGKGNKDMYGVSIAYGSNEFSGIVQTAEKSVFDVLPVLNTDKGGIWLRDTNGFSVFRTQAVITDNAKNPEVICRWFDNAFALENGIGCSRGPVGTVVFKEDAGYRAIDSTTLPADQQEKVSWNNLWPQALPKYMPTGFKYIEDNPLYDEKKAMEGIYEPNLTQSVIPSFWVAVDSIDRYSDIATALNDYFNQQQAMFVTGELDVNDDAEWKNYVDGLYSLGLEDWLNIRGIETIAE